jgi:hypothetical protein
LASGRIREPSPRLPICWPCSAQVPAGAQPDPDRNNLNIKFVQYYKNNEKTIVKQICTE